MAETRVVDGDTLIHQGERIRIWGLDCAEQYQDLGRKAKIQLELLIEGNRIILEPVPQPRDQRWKCRAYDERCKRAGYCDCYGRTLARVFIQRTSRSEFFTFDAACAMIQSRHCQEFSRYSNNYYARCTP